MNHPIVFLDIDGVCNYEDFLEANRHKRCYPDFDDDDWLDPERVCLLNRIVEETGAKFVLSSSWRIVTGVTKTFAALKQCGFTGDLIDETPSMSHEKFEERRAAEIHDWLYRHSMVDRWVVLDDNKVLVEPSWRFVQTHFSVGLTEALIDRAIEVLRRTDQ